LVPVVERHLVCIISDQESLLRPSILLLASHFLLKVLLKLHDALQVFILFRLSDSPHFCV
jgi:hypothetical protein